LLVALVVISADAKYTPAAFASPDITFSCSDTNLWWTVCSLLNSHLVYFLVFDFVGGFEILVTVLTVWHV
jgi:hypothetical protein